MADLVGELTAYTPSTLTSPSRLDEELATVRRQGYAVAADELDVGLTAVAGPVHNAHGEVVASVSVSGPTFRFGEARMHQVVPLVTAAADEVSAAMGWLGPDRADED